LIKTANGISKTPTALFIIKELIEVIMMVIDISSTKNILNILSDDIKNNLVMAACTKSVSIIGLQLINDT
jgi:hypothetical protein